MYGLKLVSSENNSGFKGIIIINNPLNPELFSTQSIKLAFSLNQRTSLHLAAREGHINTVQLTPCGQTSKYQHSRYLWGKYNR